MGRTLILRNGLDQDKAAPLYVLLRLLGEHPLDPSREYENGKFWAPAHMCRVQKDESTGWVATYHDAGPIYPEMPEAVRFSGSFNDRFWPFRIDTDERSVILSLKRAIRANMARRGYQEAKREWLERSRLFSEQVLSRVGKGT